VASGDEQCFEAELKHGGVGIRKLVSGRLLLKTERWSAAGSEVTLRRCSEQHVQLSDRFG
jgi:hypothetical protein